jgi:hypothetical protein
MPIGLPGRGFISFSFYSLSFAGQPQRGEGRRAPKEY